MDRSELAARIDHTELGADTQWRDVKETLDVAQRYGMNACVPPSFVERCAAYAPDTLLATVIGFPHGHHHTRVKVLEAELAHADGADELDMVIDVGALKDGDDDHVRADVAAVVDATPLLTKVIVEATLLTHLEKERVGELVVEAGADMLKTSTGFSGRGATVRDVRLLSQYLPVKASGGISTWGAAKTMFDLGAVRIGASSGEKIVEDFEAEQQKAGTEQTRKYRDRY